MSCRSMESAKSELDGQLAEVCARTRSATRPCQRDYARSQVQDGVTSIGAAEQTADGEGATASIETLEGVSGVIRLDLGGVRAEPSGAADFGAAVFPTTVYDSVSSFLINVSPGYKAHFNQSLFAALAQVKQEREEQAAREAEATKKT